MERADLPICPLFEGVAPEALPKELHRLWAAERLYDAGETLLAAGCPTERMGLVLEGELHAFCKAVCCEGSCSGSCWRWTMGGKAP